eukprot:4911697-Amphidinium_carterae.1
MSERTLTSRSPTLFQAPPALVHLQNSKKYSNHNVRASPHASPPEIVIPFYHLAFPAGTLSSWEALPLGGLLQDAQSAAYENMHLNLRIAAIAFQRGLTLPLETWYSHAAWSGCPSRCRAYRFQDNTLC